MNDLAKLLELTACPPWCGGQCNTEAADAVLHEVQLAEGGPATVDLCRWVGLSDSGSEGHVEQGAVLWLEGNQVDGETRSAAWLRSVAATLVAAADRMDEILGSEQ